MLVEFKDSVPDDKERPFLVAGLVGVFLLEGEPFPLGVSPFGVAVAQPLIFPHTYPMTYVPIMHLSKKQFSTSLKQLKLRNISPTYLRQFSFELEAMEELQFGVISERILLSGQ